MNLFKEIKMNHKKINKNELVNDVIRKLYAAAVLVIAYDLVDVVSNLKVENMSAKQLTQAAMLITSIGYFLSKLKEFIEEIQK